MTYIINPDGRISYRANWTDPDSLRSVMDYFLEKEEAAEKQPRQAPFYMEVQGQRGIDREAFLAGLLENGGERALEEFIEAMAENRGERMAEKLRSMAERIEEQNEDVTE